MKKNSFTLVEILVSITIFSIVVLFLYETLDMTKKSNNFYSEKLEDKQEQTRIKKILFLDMMHKVGDIKIDSHKDGSKIVKFRSKNIYHNPFYDNITYLVSRDKNLIRIESKKEFDQKKLDDDFFKNSYIDHFDTNVTKLQVKKQADKSLVFYILKENKEKMLFRFLQNTGG